LVYIFFKNKFPTKVKTFFAKFGIFFFFFLNNGKTQEFPFPLTYTIQIRTKKKPIRLKQIGFYNIFNSMSHIATLYFKMYF